MKKIRSLQNILLVFSVSIFLLGAGVDNVNGALNPNNFIADLNELVLDGNSLAATLESLVLSPFSMAAQLASLEDLVDAYLRDVGDVYKTVSASTDNTNMSLTNEMLVPLEILSGITLALSNSLTMLSESVVSLSYLTSVAILSASLDSMLQLSDDIGVMADRIIEMADKILIMADNIGLMADRIIVTQTIQSENLKLTLNAILETQKNILPLFGV